MDFRTLSLALSLSSTLSAVIQQTFRNRKSSVMYICHACHSFVRSPLNLYTPCSMHERVGTNAHFRQMCIFQYCDSTRKVPFVLRSTTYEFETASCVLTSAAVARSTCCASDCLLWQHTRVYCYSHSIHLHHNIFVET